MNKQKIPTTLVTGFLGSGKTTLLSSVLKQVTGRRVAVVVSVPLESSIDTEILRGTDCDAVEDVQRLPLGNRIYKLSNGNLCCAVQHDFAHIMQELARRSDDIDHIMIETPGTVLPLSFIRCLSSDDLSSHFTIDSVITVVDGPALAEGRYSNASSRLGKLVEPDLQFLCQAQLDIADIVLISKVDLAFSAVRKKLPTYLKALLSHEPEIITMQHGLVNPNLLFGHHCCSESKVGIDKIQIDEDHVDGSFESVMIEMGCVDSDLLVSRLQMLIHEQDVYRTKGFAGLPNKVMRQVVQGVGSRIDRSYDRRWVEGEERNTRLQIIGRHLDAERLKATLRVAEIC